VLSILVIEVARYLNFFSNYLLYISNNYSLFSTKTNQEIAEINSGKIQRLFSSRGLTSHATAQKFPKANYIKESYKFNAVDHDLWTLFLYATLRNYT
jgi:hypothetical protein